MKKQELYIPAVAQTLLSFIYVTFLLLEHAEIGAQV